MPRIASNAPTSCAVPTAEAGRSLRVERAPVPMAPHASIVIPAPSDAAALARAPARPADAPGVAESELAVGAADREATERAVAGQARLIRPPASTGAELMNAGAAAVHGRR